MAVEKTHHQAYDSHYHLVCTVKYRKTLLNNDIPLAIVQIAQEIGDAVAYRLRRDRPVAARDRLQDRPIHAVMNRKEPAIDSLKRVAGILSIRKRRRSEAHRQNEDRDCALHADPIMCQRQIM